jgi:membrane protein involved in colicin uptake
MAVRPGNSAAKKQTTTAKSSVSPAVLIAAIALAVLIVGGLAYHYFGPQQGGGTGTVRALTADEQWVRQKARESGGEFSKLSQEDQRRMFSIAGPKAPFDLRQMAREIKVAR